MKTHPSHTIGVSIPRVGAIDRLLGRAIFAGDMAREGMVTVLALRSDRPHARILNIDTSAAEKTPGCAGVFTAKDVPGRNRLGIINKDQRLLADDKVRFVGEAVALVAGETLEAAQEALQSIRVEYEDLPAVLDPEEALAPGAAPIHEDGNLLARRMVIKGDADEALKTADVVMERVYSTTFIEHTYLEPDAGMAFIEPDGVLTVYASTQNPHYDQKDVADLLGLEENLVRVIQVATGGGFGSKLDLNVQGFVALAAYRLKRPARMVYTREEAYLCTAKRHPLKIHYTTGATKDGKLVAAKVRIIGDTGAYGSYGIAVTSRAAVHATGPYEVPNVHVESVFAYTNNPMCGAMRGFGVPQVAFAHESQMDLLAQELDMSPLQIRKENVLKKGSRTATGQKLEASVGIESTLDAVAPHYLREILEKPPNPKPHVKRGVGLGSMIYGIGNTGMRNPSTARIELNDDGGITLFTGAADIGQGSSTVLKQIAASMLGLSVEEVRMVVADTRYTTSAGATSASRQTYISGNAVMDAAKKLKDVLLTEAAMMLRTGREELELENGCVRSIKDPDASVPFTRIVRRAHRTGLPLTWQGYFDPETIPLDPETGQGSPYATYAFATHAAVVEIDTLSGEVRVKKVIAAHDVGKAINPQNVHGQIYSGVAMGVGFAVMEEYIPGSTESMKDYHIPTAADMPEVTSIIIEDPEPTGPFGAKGVGEPALIPTAPAVLNAIANGLGVRIYDLPANLERVLKASLSMKSK